MKLINAAGEPLRPRRHQADLTNQVSVSRFRQPLVLSNTGLHWQIPKALRQLVQGHRSAEDWDKMREEAEKKAAEAKRRKEEARAATNKLTVLQKVLTVHRLLNVGFKVDLTEAPGRLVQQLKVALKRKNAGLDVNTGRRVK